MMDISSERHKRSNRRKYHKKKRKDFVFLPSSEKNFHDDPVNSPKSFTITEQNKENFSIEEQKIYEIAKISYSEALEHYFFPSLPFPQFLFDYSNNTGFHIDFNNYKITLNLANTPNIFLDKELTDYFQSLSIHEIGHYVYCPYDNHTNLKLLSVIIKQKVSKYHAPMILNIFADLLIDYKNHLEFPKLMEWELKTTINYLLQNNNFSQSDFWKLLVKAYEIMWDFELEAEIDFSNIESVAKRISQIIIKDIDDDSKWEKKVIKIAKLLKDIVKKDCKLRKVAPPKRSSSGQERMGENTSPIEVPEDVKATFGDLSEIKYPDFVKKGEGHRFSANGPEVREQLKQDLEELAIELNYSTFQDLLNINGFHNSNENLALWYRGQAKNLIKIEIYTKKPSGTIPFAPKIWRVGDPIEDLDPIQSFLASPVIIPNITTRKWEYKEGPGNIIHNILPDLMIVLDSSASMDWNFGKRKISGRYHTALLGAFAALHYASLKGAYSASINFSDRVYYSQWTNQVHKIEKVLLKYQGYGTVLPISQIEKLTHQNDQPCMILLISDLEIENWENILDRITRLLKNGHILIAFFIEGNPEILESPDFKLLTQLGAKFYAVQDEDDLTGLVLAEVKEIYAPKDEIT